VYASATTSDTEWVIELEDVSQRDRPEGAKLAGGVCSIKRSTSYPSYIELDVQH